MKKKKIRRGRRGRRKQTRFVDWFKKLSKIQKILLGLGVVVVCLLSTLVIYMAWALGEVQHEEVRVEDLIINDMAEDVGVGYTNIALFGIDARNGINEGGTRTDTIIIASLNNKTKEVKLVSVYRDTLLDLTNGKIQKCNAAYSKGGATQAISMLNMNLDLQITDFVTVDWSAVVDAVDLLGGLEIDIQPEELNGLNKCIKETAIVTENDIEYVNSAGLQHLNGVQVTAYCRIRSTAGSDFRRTERQRDVIQKMAEKTMKSDLKTINSMIEKIFPKIKTSLTRTEILSYAKDFARYKITENSGFPFKKGSGKIPGKGDSVYPVTLKSNVSQLHEFLYGTEDYEPSSKVASISAEIAEIVKGRKNDVITSDTTKPSDTTTPGEGDTTTPGEGDTTTPGEGEEPTPGEGEEPTPGEGEEPTPGEGEEPTPGEGEEPTPSEGEEPTPGSDITENPVP